MVTSIAAGERMSSGLSGWIMEAREVEEERREGTAAA
jgi:hypothetical protein